ncbi:MAG: MFS transporter [Lachnospiraceae bacterium]|nr:MFS transporter [Lachnospiraceae bacterium]
MAVTAIGTAVSNKNSDNLTVQYASDFGNVTVNIIEIDDADAATGNELLYSDNITLSVTADSKEFEEAIDSGDLLTYSEKNSDYEIKFDDITINADNSTIVFETDTGILDGGDTTTLKVWLDSEEFTKLDKTGGLSSITGTFTSTKEVERYGFKYFALIVAILFVVFVVITCLGIKEKSTADMKTATIGEMFKALIQNDQAMTIVITIVLINIATYITSNLLIYFFKYDLAGSNWQGNYTLFNTFAGGIQILSMMIIFPVLRKFFTTIKIFNIAVISSISGYVVLLVMALAGTSSVYPFLIPGFFIMAAVGVLNVLVTIFLANTVDYGELKNGRRDESVIFSMQTFVVKLASGIAALVASICLSVSNISDDTSTVGAAKTAVGNSSLLILRLTMTLLPIFGMIIAIILFRKKYILDENKLDEITTTLKEKVND